MKKIFKHLIIIFTFIFFFVYVGITGRETRKIGEKMWSWAKK